LAFSFLSDVTLYPAMLIDTRMKVQGSGILTPWISYTGTIHAYQRVLINEGVRGLYRGFWVSVCFNPPAQIVYYGSYEGMKTGFEKFYRHVERTRRDSKKGSRLPKLETIEPLAFFTFGALAEVSAASFFVPLNVICGRLQIQGTDRVNSQYNYIHGRDAIRQMWKEEGISGFYRGFGSSMARDMPASAVSWLCYETFTRKLAHFFQRHNILIWNHTLTEHFIATFSGIGSGVVTALTTNPLHLASVLLQVQPCGKKMYSNGWDALKTTVREEGMLALWKGSLARILTLAPACGFGFTLFEMAKSLSRKERS